MKQEASPPNTEILDKADKIRLLVGTAHPTEFDYACDANGDEQIDLADFAVPGQNWQ